MMLTRNSAAVILCAFLLSALTINAVDAQELDGRQAAYETAGDARLGRSAAKRQVRYDATVIGSRPAGCPARYCGCRASLVAFGRIVPDLNLAANWIRKFQRTTPSPGKVAANRRHVMTLLSHVSGSDWLVDDGNSGGGLTRRHVRSIRGYVIVDPQASRVASR